ncbi:MAG: hypothetical protein IJR20_01370 [Muribaculaceae bacterium]|nr:hypothetical protein [Muribaculaceae bacterium]
MRKCLLIVTACLVGCLTQTAVAYEYEFDLAEMGKNVYQAVESYESGVTIYIHTGGDQAPNIHAWNSEGNLTNAAWPGVKMTDQVAVNVKGDDNNKKSYYRMHFDVSEMAFIVNFNGDDDKTTDTYITGEGSYFFDYNGNGGSTLQQDDEYYSDYSPASHDKINLYVKVIDSNEVPYAYYWSQYYQPDWNQSWAHHQFTNTVTINGESWYHMQLQSGDMDGGGVIFTTNTNQNQTSDIKGLAPGNHYFYYYPNGSGQRYSEIGIGVGGNTNNYDEYTFHPFWTVDGSIVYVTTENEHGTATIKMQCTSPEEASRVELVDGKYLLVPKGTTFTGYQGEGNALNEMYLGPLSSSIGGQDIIQFGKEVDGIIDYSGKGDMDNYFIAGMKGVEAGANSISCTIPGHYQDTYLGPKMMIRDEYVSSEDLTFSDHNTMGQYHQLDDAIVGVQVVEIGTNNKKSYLICRSLNPISAAHKHKKNDNQEIWVNTKGVTPAFANPETPQYAWIGLEISNPEQYVNKTINNVRGLYYPDALQGQAPWAIFVGTSEFYNYKMFNPIMKVVGEPVCGTETVETAINTYCTANLCEQDGKQYFFMEPRPFEIANIIDVMRTDDQVLWVPKANAILPEGQTVNEYAEYGITGWAAIIDRSYDMWEESDKELFGENAQGWAWRLRDKVYDVPNALVLLATYNPNDNPLDQPNREYYGWSSDKSLGYHIQGKAQIREYEEDMVVGKGDYWSRYEYGDNKNAYRNDIEITIYKPKLNLEEIGNMWVQRIDAAGNVTNIAKLVQQGTTSNFTMSYLNETQTARNDAKLAEIEKAPFGEGQYNLQNANIGISDMFYSSLMDNRAANTTLSSHFEYQVVPFDGNTNELSCVVTSAPVFKTNENVVSRANYTQEQVVADIDNQLEQRDVASITFTPNMERGMTEYRVYKAELGANEGGKKWELAYSEISVDENGFLNPTFTDNIDENVSMEYVPEVYTAYNNNTYGCYKQSVSDAEVTMNLKDLIAAETVNSDGSRYCHAVIDLNSVIKNIGKDSRYLIRVWRQVGNGSLTLLNSETEGWETNYEALDLQGLDDPEAFGKAGNIIFELHDTFKAYTTDGVSGMKAEGETVNIEDVTYYVTLYVKDDASDKYYVKKYELKPNTSVPTAIAAVDGSAQVESVSYYNAAGIESNKPFDGVNIVVTRYSNGSTTTSKLVK